MNIVNKYVYCTLVFLSLFTTTKSGAQSNAFCYVRYSNMSDQSFIYNQWCNYSGSYTQNLITVE